MGIVRMGPPEETVLEIASHFGIDTFVETGTYEAQTALWASKHFHQVYTIEAAELFYEKAVARYGHIEGLQFIYGHSVTELGKLADMLELDGKKALFWLDAHWSGGETYGEQDECPLLDELKIILDSNQEHIILIDDARLFLAPPPENHDRNAWPNICDICECIREKKYKTIVFQDVIFAYPENNRLFMENLLQRYVTDEWNEYGESKRISISNAMGNIMSGLKMLARGIKEGKL